MVLSPIAFGAESTTNASSKASATAQTNAVKQEKVSNIVVTTNTNVTAQTNAVKQEKTSTTNTKK